ncbi:MAG: branched-chain amino acid ABC transporter substrate-binding protein [Solirubrobacterales bacterium]
MNRRRAALAGLAALVLGVGGCAGDDGEGRAGGGSLSVYVSVPLDGARGAEGRGIADGARLALAEARGRAGGIRVRAVYMDDTVGGRWSLARTAENARRAVEDSSAIGYIGDLDSGATRVSLPITNQAGIVQISPGSTAVDLTRLPPVGSLGPERLRPSGEETFARVVPDDEVQARGAAIWAERMGAGRVGVAGDGSQFGRVLSQAFLEQAAESGLGSGEGGGVDLVYYAGGPEAFRAAVRGIPPRRVIGSDALIDPAFLRSTTAVADRLFLTSPFIDPALLPPAGRRFARVFGRRFGRPAPPSAAYGYEGMALLLDAIRRAGDDGDERDAVVDEVLSTVDRRSPLGTYSIDGNGDTTLDAVSGYRISDGLPVFPVSLEAPR